MKFFGIDLFKANKNNIKLQQKKEILQSALGGQKSKDLKIDKLKLTERKALLASTFLNIVAVSALVVVVAGGDHRSYSNEELKQQTKVERAPIKYGFNTHVHAELDTSNDNMTLGNFKRNVDIMSSNNLDIVRIDIRAKDIAREGDSRAEVKLSDNIKVYIEAIRYAKEKDLDVFLVTNVPEFASNYSHEEYKRITADFYTKLILSLENQLGDEDVIQFFNEPNKHSYRNHTEISSQPTDTYMQELSEVIDVATKSVKNVNNEVIVTTNLSYWVGRNENLYTIGPAFFDKLTGLDAISLDLYPDNRVGEIAKLPEYIKFFHDRYQKPIYLAEIGLPTYVFSQYEQAESLSASINALQNGDVRPKGIIVHEIMDVTAPEKEAEKTFGIYYSNGTPKQSAFSVINAMQSDEFEK